MRVLGVLRRPRYSAMAAVVQAPSCPDLDAATLRYDSNDEPNP